MPAGNRTAQSAAEAASQRGGFSGRRQL